MDHRSRTAIVPTIVPASCDENEYVLNGVCVQCPSGQINEAGDLPEDEDTYCDTSYILIKDTNAEGEIDCPSTYQHIVNQGECQDFKVGLQDDNFHIFNGGDIVQQPGVKQDIMNDYESNGFNFFNIRGGRCRANHPVGCWLTNPTTRDQPWTLLNYAECQDPSKRTTAQEFLTNSVANNYAVCKRND